MNELDKLLDEYVKAIMVVSPNDYSVQECRQKILERYDRCYQDGYSYGFAAGQFDISG